MPNPSHRQLRGKRAAASIPWPRLHALPAPPERGELRGVRPPRVQLQLRVWHADRGFASLELKRGMTGRVGFPLGPDTVTFVNFTSLHFTLIIILLRTLHHVATLSVAST